VQASNIRSAGRLSLVPDRPFRINIICVQLNDGPEWRKLSRERKVKIEIYDQSYNVNAEGNEEYFKELAAYVDNKMRSIAEATRMVDSLKVAVLAALNIADETFTLRQRQQEIDGPLRKRVEKCVAMVEKALEHTN
jgi:cell division protein ZapA